ncbi:VanW family protein [Paenibacillus chartarius]|uniref:VanW family protein n=1 Tax=Paenibacillus chartarius TaxID=747481 RepID=A0ABV6DF18_9BACL
MFQTVAKPKRRSALRLALGAWWYRMRRYGRWAASSRAFARTMRSEPLSYVAFEHRTPLYRKLKDVDMWLQHNKVVNLSLALPRLNGIVVMPGETFSYWRLIGKPTKRKGYVPGMVLSSGSFRAGIGGGLCQLSNLIYWMALHTPLQVTERHRHSYDVFPDVSRTQPFGSGATCYYNYIDLQIRNPTSEPYQLKVWMEDGYLCGEWRSASRRGVRYRVYEKEHRIRMEPWGGYTRSNSIWRQTMDEAGTVLHDEWITDNHAIMMYEPMLTEGKTEAGTNGK